MEPTIIHIRIDYTIGLGAENAALTVSETVEAGTQMIRVLQLARDGGLLEEREGRTLFWPWHRIEKIEFVGVPAEAA